MYTLSTEGPCYPSSCAEQNVTVCFLGTKLRCAAVLQKLLFTVLAFARHFLTTIAFFFMKFHRNPYLLPPFVSILILPVLASFHAPASIGTEEDSPIGRRPFSSRPGSIVLQLNSHKNTLIAKFLRN